MIIAYNRFAPFFDMDDDNTVMKNTVEGDVDCTALLEYTTDG